MQFLVIAHDGTDPEAPTRRQHARERHLEAARSLAAEGVILIGGALLDEEGQMIGSALVMEAPDEPALRRALEADVYHREGVWRRYEIHPFRRAV